MSKARSVVFVALVALSFGLYWFGTKSGGTVVPDASGVSEASPEESRLVNASLELEGKLYGTWSRFSSADFVVSMGLYPLHELLPEYKKGVEVVIGEAPSSSAPDEQRRFELFTSYDVIDAQPHWSRDVYVQGVAADGSSVLEHWYFPPQTGGWTSYAQAASTSIGAPGPSQPMVSVGLVGGTYIPPAERTNVQRVRRREIYRGASPSVECFSYDLDGRFLIFVGDSPRALYVISSVGASQTPQVAYSPAQLPELAIAKSINPVHHKGAGRGYYVELGGSASDPDIALLWDVDNDGLIDFHDLLTEEAYEIQYPDSSWDLSVLPWARDF